MSAVTSLSPKSSASSSVMLLKRLDSLELSAPIGVLSGSVSCQSELPSMS